MSEESEKEDAVDFEIKKALKDQISRLEILQDRIKEVVDINALEHSQGIKQIVIFVTKTQIQTWIASLKHKIDTSGNCEICELEKILGKEALEIAEAVMTALNNRNEEAINRVLKELLEKTSTTISTIVERIPQVSQL
jgi:hypothetical protein